MFADTTPSSTGTSFIASLPSLITGATNIITATQGEAKQLPVGTTQLSGVGMAVQQTPPFDWMPIVLIGGALIFFSMMVRKKNG